ncbi:hypothetical protein HY632_04605 [Candidatus Uhrbacteria bacterium]|nr:hypothetical protein [Candidatus Uhrbacteria bacterium]
MASSLQDALVKAGLVSPEEAAAVARAKQEQRTEPLTAAAAAALTENEGQPKSPALRLVRTPKLRLMN